MFFPLADENFGHKIPWMTIVLILLNLLIFYNANYLYQASFYGSSSLEHFIDDYGFYSNDINLSSLVFSLFIHGGWFHLLFNMWFLWLFGNNVEEHLGHIKFLLIYFVSGIVGSLAFAVLTSQSLPLIGASGAISGILGAYCFMCPHNKIKTFFLYPHFLISLIYLKKIGKVFYIRAYWYAIIWFITQLLANFLKEDACQVAYISHIGGFLIGLLLATFLGQQIARQDFHGGHILHN